MARAGSLAGHRRAALRSAHRLRVMRASAFTLVALLVPGQPVAAFIGGVAPRARLLSTRPSTLTAELARRRAFRAPQPTLTATKAAEPAKPRKATLSEWGTLLRLCSQDTLLVAFAFVMLVFASAGDVMLPQLQARALNLVLVGSTPRSAQMLALQRLQWTAYRRSSTLRRLRW